MRKWFQLVGTDLQDAGATSAHSYLQLRLRIQMFEVAVRRFLLYMSN